jgi:hypothetical protein
VSIILSTKISSNHLETNKNFPLEHLYTLCVQEIGLQQSKRDQIIAFYLALMGLIIPNILKLSIDIFLKGFTLLILFVLGLMLISTLIRYRVYKESYWITSRTLLQLYNIKPSDISKEIVQLIFLKTLEKNHSSVIGLNKKQKPSLMKTYKKNSKSAEFIMFHVLVLIVSLILSISVYLFLDEYTYLQITLSFLAFIGNFLYCGLQFIKALMSNYKCIDSYNDEDFNSVYSKAWFLHMFLDQSIIDNSSQI